MTHEHVVTTDVSLTDDLAKVLASTLLALSMVGIDLAEHPEVERVLARYQDSKVVCTAVVWHGPGHQSRTTCEVRGAAPHRHYAMVMGDEVEWDSPIASLDYDGRTTYARVLCTEGDGCQCLREPGASTPCPGYMHPRNR